jgi:hypothetical protein
MKTVSNLSIILFILGLWSCAATNAAEKPDGAEHAKAQLDQVVSRALSYLESFPIDSMSIPRALSPDGSLHATSSRDWTSGFYPGELWLLYEYSQEDSFKDAAQKWTSFIEKEKKDTHTHDLGFKLHSSFGHGYRLTQEPHYQEVILEASQTLIKRYNEQVGCIRSWDFNADIWHFPVIIDNMINLEMLFAATRLSGDSMYYQIAYQHALTTLRNHIRPDHSAYHVIDFDPESGKPRLRDTHQGAAIESSWARGQAWNLYGFAIAYRETGDPQFLDQAKGIAHYIYQHPALPEDKIPYWDFEAPLIPNEPRDVSAAAVNACGLILLAELEPENRSTYLQWADATLQTLSRKEFQSDKAPFLLKHSVGSVPGEFEVDVPIIYADYYYVKALLSRLKVEKSN